MTSSLCTVNKSCGNVLPSMWPQISASAHDRQSVGWSERRPPVPVTPQSVWHRSCERIISSHAVVTETGTAAHVPYSCFGVNCVCEFELYKSKWGEDIKAALINIFILTMDQITMCNMKGVTRSIQHPQLWSIPQPLHCALPSFSLLFWFNGTQL